MSDQAGTVVSNPPAIFNQNEYLSIRLSYQTRTHAEGSRLFGFMTPDGLENPICTSLRAIAWSSALTNNTPATPIDMPLPPHLWWDRKDTLIGQSAFSRHQPYPKVTVLVDFRGPDILDFVYHCHIAEHEDDRMMAIFRAPKYPRSFTE